MNQGPLLVSAGGKTHPLPHISEKAGSSRARGLLVCGHSLASTASGFVSIVTLLEMRQEPSLTSSFVAEVAFFHLGLLCVCRTPVKPSLSLMCNGIVICFLDISLSFSPTILLP